MKVKISYISQGQTVSMCGKERIGNQEEKIKVNNTIIKMKSIHRYFLKNHTRIVIL